MSKYQIGDQVTWKDENDTVHTGTVVVINPRREHPIGVFFETLWCSMRWFTEDANALVTKPKPRPMCYDTGVVPIRLGGSFDRPGYYAVGQYGYDIAGPFETEGEAMDKVRQYIEHHPAQTTEDGKPKLVTPQLLIQMTTEGITGVYSSIPIDVMLQDYWINIQPDPSEQVHVDSDGDEYTLTPVQVILEDDPFQV
jgi:hypothetical protein